ncbi:MAG: hypothetical protein K2X27_26215 [Candidatus Obscuribacterales bacterium]|nr:hypothetical protein [Candidatus Obscuribacterales bacterium]
MKRFEKLLALSLLSLLLFLILAPASFSENLAEKLSRSEGRSSVSAPAGPQNAGQGPPMLPSISSAPMLPGATNTIGLPNPDPNSFVAPPIARTGLKPEVPYYLVFIPFIALALFLISKRGRSNVWELAALAVVIFLGAGIAFGIFMLQ